LKEDNAFRLISSASLAEDRKELAVGLILSGMGSDGSLGIRAIKEKNGIAMVQDPTNAKFDSMPRNAINSVSVDIVAPVNELPGRLYEFLKHIPVLSTIQDVEIKDKSSLEKIISLLRTYTGNDLDHIKRILYTVVLKGVWLYIKLIRLLHMYFF